MNFTHLHLMITHLPLFGSILGALVLIYGMITKNSQVKMAAYYVLIVSAVGGVIAYSTGEFAEETVENIQGIVKNNIEEHEEFAEIALISIIALGILSLAGVYTTLKKPSLARAVSIIVLIASLACFGLTAWTGYLGGHVRHTELKAGGAVPPGQEQMQKAE